MTETTDKYTGGCMCGAIRFEATGAPVNSNYCHCESCRKHTSAPVVALVGYTVDQVTFTKGQRKFYQSSPGVNRAFCGDCGTPLTWEGEGGSGEMLVEILTGAMDNPDAFPPETHYLHAERISWFDTADHLPRYSAFDEPPYMTEPAIK
ncbi:MAG: GFA family protein [Rhodospirillales bacterium]|nr:GFA family protein [Rhodospirillales bacterium]